ncbi:hypothetical protein [Sulfurihydrogenibium sp.]|jgi:hypothetical protein|uniref:hypothetical protein n=1 Tax=Sulfurihydrogenibium sp. TaxID=2053621 RepID=UPI002604BF57|nr:hypothetical protein [Sulfurihydrogenibium sp.]
MKLKRFLLAVGVASSVLIASCGGGGGGGGAGGGGSIRPQSVNINISGIVDGQDLFNSSQSAGGQSLQTQQTTSGDKFIIKDALVTVESSYGDKKQFVTSEDGKFFIPDLKVNPNGGWVKITVEKEGFARYEKVLKYNDPKEINGLVMEALLDPIKNTKVVNFSGNELNLTSQQTGNPEDDFVSIAVVKDPSTDKQQILSGQELKTQLRKNSNLMTVWQLDINKQLLKQQNITALIASVNNYDPTKPEHMKKFPSYENDKGQKLVSAGFDFVDVRDQSGKPLTLKANQGVTMGVKSQEFPTSYRVKRSISGNLIKCDEDLNKNGVQIGLYYMYQDTWRFLGYATIYDSSGNTPTSISSISSTGTYYAIVTDQDVKDEIALNNYINFDHVLTACQITKFSFDIEVDLIDENGNPVDGYVDINYDNNYTYGSANKKIKFEGITADENKDPKNLIKNVNIYYWTYYDYKSIKGSVCNPDGNNPNYYICKITVVNPYKCTVTGKVVDENGKGLANKYVYSDISLSSAVTGTDGSFKLEKVKCNQDGTLYAGYYYSNSNRNFNVNGTTDINNEQSDDSKTAVLKDIQYKNSPPVAYAWVWTSTVESGKQLYLYGYG